MARAELKRLLRDAPPVLCDILNSAHGTVLAPIRSEIFGAQRFAQHGRSLGETHRAAVGGSAAANFFPRVRSNVGILRKAHRYIGAQASSGYDISPAAEWLLENFHLIEAQLKEIHDGLPSSYFRSLPVLADEPLAGLPRVYGVAWAFVAHTDGAFDEELLVRFLTAYQETRELKLSEMWALPTTLRVVLIENLRRLAERVATHKAAREVANLCCDRIDSCGVPMLGKILAVLERRGVGLVFLAQMALRLQDRPAAGDPHLQEWLRAALPDPAAVRRQQSVDQAADNLSVSNAVRSLRAIGDADWLDIVARASELIRLMLGSPVFEAEDAATRDMTLHGIEFLARRSGCSELSVAQALLDRMQAAPPDGDAPAVASFWLQGAGRPELFRALGLNESAAVAWRMRLRRLALPVYLIALLAATTTLVYGLLARAEGGGDALWLTLLGAVLMTLPASEAIVAVINRLISESVRPVRLPRLAFAQGIPAGHRVLVVIPAMLTDPESVRALAHRLQQHYLANPERHAQFALLTDWVDADTARTPSDAALLADAEARVGELNALHPVETGMPSRFLLLHRERTFSRTEQRWIGWERKRGKLEQLIAALAQGASGVFHDLGDASHVAPDVRYLVTLDSDTRLPAGRLRELAGVAAHPQNRPQLDGGRVVAGYGIFQPRIVTPLPMAVGGTWFHWLFAGRCGIDPYSAATSEVYQDVFGEGTFTGKGLLDVRAMHAVLSDRLPEGTVLSHDLLEGAFARCALVTDVALIEDAPFHADVVASRVHRWTRGDWQLLPFLLRARRYRLRAVNRWKMFDNLRRSLVAPASLALLVLAATGHVVAPWVAISLVAAALLAGPLMGALAGFVPGRRDLAIRPFFGQALVELARALCGGLWLFAMLLAHALGAADAIVRALYRMTVSRRHLLQWTTAAAAQDGAALHVGALLRKHWSVPVVALALGAAMAAGTPFPGLAVGLALIWAAAPIWIAVVSRPRTARRRDVPTRADARYLEGIARDTWRLFERCVVAEDNHLPPDNLQTSPTDEVAHRTSPTNIGLYLLTVACAHRFGWIGTQELMTRLDATLATLATLQRHRGHFLNWYDTRTRAPLLPMYVSTVDSGNLSGHLLAVAQACRQLADEQDDGALGRLLALASSCESLARQADFSFLYHGRRNLFHIGYRVAEQQLDAGFYDLLASESRLTSLLAIANGDVPVRHWTSLGRPFCAFGARVGLRSWSGSMFEYLMPTLVTDERPGGMLRDACIAALGEQIAFARARQVPWGISESAYAGRDHTMAYQYAPQGVPRLALRRTPSEELVIAPYATALAAQIAPRAACANFRELEALGARSRYGFIEALDFSPARRVGDEPFTRVDAFMAHHQGMTIVALANVLLGGVAQRWGMADARIEAVSSLLHERAPREVSTLHGLPEQARLQALQQRAPGLLRDVAPGATAIAPTHLLSNGRYNVSLRANGAGWSRWGEVGITRWRDDALRDAFGSFFYLRWDRQPRPVSITQHPAPDPDAHYHSVYHADRVCFDAVWPDVSAQTTVWVSPEDDIEFRQVELCNRSDRVLDIELMSAFEVTLTDARADEAHPAFTNLFVGARWRPADQALVFERRPRLAGETGLKAAHFLVHADPQVVGVRVQTDRQRWLGRNRDAAQPLASFDAAPLDPDTKLDTGLDPVCALSVRLRIAPGGQARLTFATTASDNGGTLSALIDKYRQPSHVERASLMSATLTGIRLRTLGISAENFAAIQTLTTALVLTVNRPHAGPRPGEGAAAGRCERRLLWRFGLSGERPLILVSVGVMQDLGLLRSLVQALRLWSWGGVACDLVVIDTEPASYEMALHREIGALRERYGADSGAEARAATTTLHLLRADELSVDELHTLRRLARLHLRADGRPLLHHLQAWTELHEQAFESRYDTSTSVVTRSAQLDRAPAGATGEFTADGSEFRFDVSAARHPGRPWINVLANPAFGAQISESGGGCTWATNSRMNQLTAWSNDPVSDPPSEWFLLQDRRTMQVWSVAPSAWGDPGAVYRVSHGQGVSTITHRRDDLEVTVSWCVDPDDAVKQVWLRLANRGSRTLQLRVIGIAEWMMGSIRADRSTADTGVFRGPGVEALACTQREHSGGFGDGTAFLALATADRDGDDDWTCDRRECFDARGHLVVPDDFGQRCGDGLDPCAALSSRFSLAAGESTGRVFLLGHAGDPAAAGQLAVRAAAVDPRQRLARVRLAWDRLLQATTVRTPDPLFDAMVNRWLLYQTVSCRMWAKAGFYQAGGATGFRDQLQDAMALAWAAPAMLREQIVLCASRQFAEGDVQHWWHAPGGAGVRTHFSDDLLWLAHACVVYLRATGDTALLDQSVPFIEGEAVPPGAEDAYFTPAVSLQHASVYEHAARAIDRSLRVGIHGLPLMGSGDWNDGMNRVGHEGRGESVWLGWFLWRLVEDFGPLARARGDDARAHRWKTAARGWKAALDGAAWDGGWYLRAFFDDGQALGSGRNAEGRIDLIAQAWSVLSGAAPTDRQQHAMAAVEIHLVDHRAGLIRLLDPPFANAVPSAGYIQAYPPGVRENGGQYSHAGVWALMAQARVDRPAAHAGEGADVAYRYFTLLSPAHRAARQPRVGVAYGIEPYVMAGDVYTQPPYVGRGGWSWYTGAAAWMHRAAVESIFGLTQQADLIAFSPCLPSHWPQAELTLRRDDRTIRFVFLRAGAAAAQEAAARCGGLVLLPGQSLRWSSLDRDARFVVPLPAVAGKMAA